MRTQSPFGHLWNSPTQPEELDTIPNRRKMSMNLTIVNKILLVNVLRAWKPNAQLGAFFCEGTKTYWIDISKDLLFTYPKEMKSQLSAGSR
jgi:hypothetical protein